jgi:hypothetical protein
MPKWAAIITGMAIITGITVTTADGFPRLRFVSHCPAAAVDPDRPAPTARAGVSLITEMRISFYPRTF